MYCFLKDKKMARFDLYGITDSMKNDVENKLFRQKLFAEFLSNNMKFTDIGKFDLANSLYSANINPVKYFSEVNNIVNSLYTSSVDN
jgi:hypothetical protein